MIKQISRSRHLELFPIKRRHLIDKKMRRNKDLEHLLVKSIQLAPSPDHPQGTRAKGGREGGRAGAA